MSIFTYTLPSGATFTVNGPADATQAQADAIFYSQTAAGTFAGYSAGQTLSSVATTLTNFGLTRLERGTAGVDNRAVLSIVNNTATTTRLGNVRQLDSILSTTEAPLATIISSENQVVTSVVISLPTIAGVPSFNAAPLISPVNQADVALSTIPLGTSNVGALSPTQVQSIQAQVVNLTGQTCNVISQSRGIGKFGLNCQQLEQTGYVKPGTTQRFLNSNYATYLPNADNFVDLLKSPSVWTNKSGVKSLDDLLSNCDLQSQIYTQLMQNSYDSLTSAGIIQPPPTPAAQPVTATVYTQSASQGGSLSILNNAALLTGVALVTPAAINLVGNLLSNTISVGNTLANISSLVSGAVTNIGNSISKLTSNISLPSLSSILDSSLTKTVTGDLAALTLNATQFGTPLTSLWTSSGGLNGITSQIPNFSNLPGQLPNINTISKLSSQIPNFSGITTQLPSLNSLTSNLPNLTSLTSRIPAISNLTGSLGSLGGLMSGFGAMGSFASAFGGGGGESPGSLVSNEQPAPAYTRTVNRTTVDIAVAKILGNQKIPTPKFGLNSDASTGASSDISYAQSNLSRLGISPSSSSSQQFGTTVTI